MDPLNQAGTAALLSANDIVLAHHVIPDTISNGMNSVPLQVWQDLKPKEEDHKLFNLDTDMTIKQEPIDIEDLKLPVVKSLRKVPKEEIHEVGHTLSEVQSTCDEGGKKKSQHSRKRLRCPQCSSSFVHGPYGAGLEMLAGHVYMKHKRLTVSCLSAAASRYSSIVKDAVAQGYLPTCSGLVRLAD